MTNFGKSRMIGTYQAGTNCNKEVCSMGMLSEIHQVAKSGSIEQFKSLLEKGCMYPSDFLSSHNAGSAARHEEELALAMISLAARR